MTRIGITGHQSLGASDVVHWVKLQLRQHVLLLDCTYGYTCLAIGTDQLFAEMLIDNGIAFTAIVPCAHYEQTFADPVAQKHYFDLKTAASRIEQLEFASPSEEAFYAAGRRVVDEADLLLAVWNGKPAQGLGGTADVVHYAREIGKKVIHLSTVDLAVIEYLSG